MKTSAFFVKLHRITGYMTAKRFRMIQEREGRRREREERGKDYAALCFYFGRFGDSD